MIHIHSHVGTGPLTFVTLHLMTSNDLRQIKGQAHLEQAREEEFVNL